MHPFESFSAPLVTRLGRARRAGDQLGRRQDEASDSLTGKYMQACRDYDASYLILAALGRRRGPLD
jgi:hypothetical protein